LLDHVKLPARIGISIRLLKDKYENSSIVGEELAPYLSLEKRVTLKSPPMRNGISHHVIRPARL